MIDNIGGHDFESVLRLLQNKRLVDVQAGKKRIFVQGVEKFGKRSNPRRTVVVKGFIDVERFDNQQINEQSDGNNQAEKDDRKRHSRAQIGICNLFIQKLVERKEYTGNQHRPENSEEERLENVQEKNGYDGQQN